MEIADTVKLSELPKESQKRAKEILDKYGMVIMTKMVCGDYWRINSFGNVIAGINEGWKLVIFD